MNARRADIQGLRAVAVVLVVLEHVLGLPEQGWVGVDVFFVISGFLITALMLREHERAGRISIAAFYRRRARRILPALTVVVGVTLAAMWTLAPAVRARTATEDAAWSSAFLGNVRFAATDSDYFAVDGPVSPFRHLWSLAVEEQYYVVWPLVLVLTLLVTRARRWPVVVVLVLTVLCSFAVGLERSTTDPTRAYYDTTVRAWELASGALVASAVDRIRSWPSWSGTVLGRVGIALVVATGCFPISGVSVPSPAVLPAVIGAVLVVVGGTVRGARAPVVLTNPVAVYLGTNSYSLYLWHFPVFVVVGIVAPDGAWIVLPVSLVVAVLSYELVERPFLVGLPGLHARRRAWRSWWSRERARLRGALLGAVALGVALSCLLVAVRLRPVVVPPAVDQALAADSGAAGSSPTPGALAPGSASASASASAAGAGPAVTELREQVFDALQAVTWPALDPSPDEAIAGTTHPECGDVSRAVPVGRCTFGPADADTTIMLVGDSTAMHELDAMILVAEELHVRLVARVAFGCPFIDARLRVDNADACAERRAETIAAVTADPPDVVVLTNTYQPVPASTHARALSVDEWADALARAVDALGDGVGSVVHVSPPPAGKDIAECAGPNTTPTACVSEVGLDWRARAEAVRALAASRGEQWVDVGQAICAEGRCPSFVGTTPVRKDSVHFSVAFQRVFAPAFTELLRGVGVPGR